MSTKLMHRLLQCALGRYALCIYPKHVVVLAGLLLGTLSLPVQAQSNTYPLSTRALFVTGCMSDEPPDYTNNPDAAYLKTRACLCILDKFQETYSCLVQVK